MPDIYRLYTVSARSGEIVEYWRIGPTGEWTRSGSSSAWGNADFGMGAIAFADAIRLYYHTKGALRQVSLDNTTWSGGVTING